ncbi:MAG: hypothetical protein J4428_00465 [Candidatus Aenigmarchaeota archaeon]|nr:hypothetical protein [Candidatus Aenigmarchaeota archaeon]
MKFCRKCGKSFRNNYDLCDVCGTKLSKVMDNFTVIGEFLKKINIRKKFLNGLLLIVAIVIIMSSITVSISIKNSILNITANIIKTSKQECASECCYNETIYKDKNCENDSTCIDNKCIIIESDNVFDCSKASFDINYINCSSENQKLELGITNTGNIDLWNFSIETSLNGLSYLNDSIGPDKNNPLKSNEKTLITYNCNNTKYCTSSASINSLKVTPGNCPNIQLIKFFDSNNNKCSYSNARIIKNRTSENNAIELYCKKVVFDISNIDCYNTGSSAVNVSVSVANTGSVSISPIFLFTSSGKEECKAMFKNSIGNGLTQPFKINCTDYGFDNTDYLNKIKVSIGNCQEVWKEKTLNDSCG